MNPVLIKCGTCQAHKPLEHFYPATQKTGKNCKACSNAKTAQYRGKNDPARRLWYNVRQSLRSQQRDEGSVWSLSDVRELLKQWKPSDALKQSGRQPKLRIVFLDKTKPSLHNNAKVTTYGGL